MSASPVRKPLQLVATPIDAAQSAASVVVAGRPAAHGVRIAALARVAAAERGYELLLAGQPDGLHDLRVALRRLRSLLRAYRPLVADTLKKKTLRTLRSLARATSQARDAEVAAAWVAAQADVPPRARAGVRDVLQRLTRDRDEATASVVARLKEEFPGLVSRLNKQLATDTINAAASVPSATFEDAATAVIARQKTRLVRALARVKSISDVDDAHRARIAAKRLRYLLEPLHDGSDEFVPLERLIALQDALGTARDAHQMTRRFVRDIGTLAARDARRRALVAIGVKRTAPRGATLGRLKPGLLELARRGRADERRAFATFRAGWGKNAALILAEIP